MPRTKAPRRALALLAVVVAAQVGRASAAPPGGAGSAATRRDEAIARFKRGLELYEEQDYEAALGEFRKAYDLSPTYKVLYNVGQVCFQLQDYACALRSFESYLFDGGAEVPSERRAEVDREVERLRLRVARLEVVTNVPGADVTIDDVAIGKTPLPAPVLVSAGKRRVAAVREGRVPAARTVVVPGAETVRVELALVEAKPDVLYVERPSKWTRASWIGVAAAGALAAGAAVTGVLALDASATLRDRKFVGSPPPDVTQQQSTVRAYALATDVLAGAAIATLAVTLVLTFVREAPPPRAAGLRLAPLGVGGTF